MEQTKKLRTISNIVLLVLGILAAGSCLVFSMGSQESQSALNFSMFFMYVLIALAVALILFFMIAQTISDKKRLVRVGILLGIAVVVVLLSYLTASSDLSDVATKLEVSQGIYKWSGALLNMAYIMLGAVVAAFLGTLVYIKIKK